MSFFFFFFQAEDGIRDDLVTGVQTCALPISSMSTLRWMSITCVLSSFVIGGYNNHDNSYLPLLVFVC